MSLRAVLFVTVCVAAGQGTWAQDNTLELTDRESAFVQQLLAEQDAFAREHLMRENGHLVSGRLVDKCLLLAMDWADASRIGEAILLSERAEEIAVFAKDPKAQGWNLISRAVLYIEYASDPDSALRCLDSACTLLQATDDKKGLGNCRLCQGEALLWIGDGDGALRMWGEALGLFRDTAERMGEALCYLQQAGLCATRGEIAQGLDLCDRALPLLKEQNALDEQAACLLVQALLHSHRSENEMALKLADEALAVSQKVPGKRRQADCYAFRAEILLLMGRVGSAAEAWAAASEIYRDIAFGYGKARCLLGRARMHTYRGETDQALEALDEALGLFRRMHHRQGEAGVYLCQGEAYFQMGDSRRTLATWDRAFTLFRELDDKLDQANCRQRQGDLCGRLQDFGLALERWSEALALYHKIGHRKGEAACYTSQAILCSLIGENELAIETLKKALQFYQETHDKLGEANTYSRLGEAYAAAGDSEAALEVLREAQARFRELDHAQGEALCYYFRGREYLEAGDPGRAVNALQEAVGMQRDLGWPHNLRMMLLWLGQALEADGETAAAGEAYRESVEVAESLMERAGSELAAAAYGSAITDSHVAYAGYLARRGKGQESYAAAERGKGRGLATLLSRGGVLPSALMTPEEQAEEARLEGVLSAVQIRLAEAVAKGLPKPELDELAGAAGKARAALNEHLEVVYARHPELPARRGEMTALDWPKTKELLGEGDAFVEYVVGEDFTVIYAGGRPGAADPTLAVEYVAHQDDRLYELCDLFRAEITSPTGQPEKAARELYKLLLGPVEKQLAGCKRLLICPDGALHEIPFQALVPQPGQYLLDRYEIAYAPSVTAHREMVKAAQAHTDADDGDGSILVVGVSSFGERGWKESLSTTQMVRKLYNAGGEKIAAGDPATHGPEPAYVSARGTFTEDGRLHPLPAVTLELEGLAELLGPRCEVMAEQEAQESRVAERMPHHRVLHFAGHGLLDQWQPFASAIALADPKADPTLAEGEEPTEDGFLEAREILQMQLNADLAVLSGCQTALGKQRRGEGIVGLAWAFFAAGCPSVVATQWRVDDESTAALMQEFYRNITAGKGTAAALRTAQLKTRESNSYAHPYYWAPFILIGSRG